ncbi:hypothetical protein AG0111_0g12496 [Alternaria gaisen]|uniref:Uncharacterized protein n=1 Tax=Alternaria gaisen TaxID=167740 RepID=A0ACB6F4B6_9PLEO|nr:hypothetical protein AG0111_0g12496 [Alternaria gaisen]
MRSREQSPALRSGGSSSHVANQSSISRGTGNEQRTRAPSKTSSKGSSDGNAFMDDWFSFSQASTYTPPPSTAAPQPVPASHNQYLGPSTHTTAGKTPASQKTVAASKRPTESSASSSRAKEDKGKNSLKSFVSSSGPKEDKGKKPAKKK